MGVDSSSDDGVAGLGELEEFFHRGTGDRGLGARGDVGENVTFLDTRFDQGVDLQFRVLASGAHTCVSEIFHRASTPQKLLEAGKQRHCAVRHVSKTRRLPEIRDFRWRLERELACLEML